MKYSLIYAIFLMLVFYTSCGQNQTNAPKDNTKPETKDIVTSYWSNNDTVHQIKKGSNGTILIASYGGMFRYDGKSFTNLTSKLGSTWYWQKRGWTLALQRWQTANHRFWA